MMIVKPCCQERSFTVRAERLERGQRTALLEVHIMEKNLPTSLDLSISPLALGLTTE